MRLHHLNALFAALSVSLVTANSFATDFPEVEPNDSRATANSFVLRPGDSISGRLSSGFAFALDYFNITTTPAPSRGIWRYRLTVNSTLSGVTLRGLSQAGGVVNATSDVAVQTTVATATPARTVQ